MNDPLKQKKIFLVIFAMMIIGLLIVRFSISHDYSVEGNKLESVSINGHTFKTEIVSTDEKMEKGLGGRDGMCADCAMIFKFQQAGTRSFWMKGMLFDLDILWIENGKVAYLKKNIPADSKDVFTPPIKADSVLELPAGTADKLGIKTGDVIIEK